MRVTELIRSSGGAEVPAPGRWRIPNSHVTISYRARTGLLERVRARAPSASGTLHIADDLRHVALVLNVGATGRSDATDAPGLGALLGNECLQDVVLRTREIVPTLDVIWRARGEIDLGPVSQPARVTITYHGVYRAGDDAKAWLTVAATIDHDVSGRRRRGPVELIADVLAVRPPVPLAPVTSATRPDRLHLVGPSRVGGRQRRSVRDGLQLTEYPNVRHLAVHLVD